MNRRQLTFTFWWFMGWMLGSAVLLVLGVIH